VNAQALKPDSLLARPPPTSMLADILILVTTVRNGRGAVKLGSLITGSR